MTDLTTPSSINTVLFIDSSVSNYQSLLAGIDSNVEVHILNNTQDGITQIAAALQGHTNLGSIQIVSHGGNGSLSLGSGVLNGSNINSYSTALSQIGSSLSATGDILLFGCNVAQDEIGLGFITQLATLTGADVAASDDLTGKGGDWVLEQSTGAVEAAGAMTAAAEAAYTGTLTAPIVTSNLAAISPTITVTQGNGSVTESASVAFAALSQGEMFTIAGITVTALNNETAVNIANAFASLTAGSKPVDTPNLQFSGALAGYTSGAASSGTVVFQSTITNTDVVDLSIVDTTSLTEGQVILSGASGSLDISDADFVSNSGSGDNVVLSIGSVTAIGTGTNATALATYINGDGQNEFLNALTLATTTFNTNGTTAWNFSIPSALPPYFMSLLGSDSIQLTYTINADDDNTTPSPGATHNVTINVTGETKVFSADKTTTPGSITVVTEVGTTISLYDTTNSVYVFADPAAPDKFNATAVPNGDGTQTITFTPNQGNSETADIKVESYVGGTLADDTHTIGGFTYVDLVRPTVTITSDQGTGGDWLNIADGTATLTFTFSEATADFTQGDITFSGGTLNAFTGSGTTYSATFTPTAGIDNGTGAGSISIAANSFSDAAGNFNDTASDNGTPLALNIDNVTPTVAITSDKSTLQAGETATITFAFSEDPNGTFTWDGTSGDLTVSGGTLSAISAVTFNATNSDWEGTATFTPTTGSTTSGQVSVASASFADAAGNTNSASSSLSSTITIDTTSISSSSTVDLLSAPNAVNNAIINITLTGTSDVNATGNALANRIVGNSGINTLNDGDTNVGTVDTLIGGAGNDIYVIGNANTVLTEGTSGGSGDEIWAAFNYTLPTNFEKFTLTDSTSTAHTLKGNNANNTIDGTASSGNLNISGGIGADTMKGGSGADTFDVDNINDSVEGGTGTDTVNSTVSFNLSTKSTGVEKLVLVGRSVINGTGDSGNNEITGNISNNSISGGDGTDKLIGGVGVDTLVGGEGQDTLQGDAGNDTITLTETTAATDKVIFAGATVTTNGADVITGFKVGATNGDVLAFTSLSSGALVNTDTSGAVDLASTAALSTEGTSIPVVNNKVYVAQVASVASINTTNKVYTALANYGVMDAVDVAASSTAFLVLSGADNATTLYIYGITNDGTAGVAIGEIALVGTITADSTTLDVANFTFA